MTLIEYGVFVAAFLMFLVFVGMLASRYKETKMATGWECQGCGRQYAPHIGECLKCNAEPKKPPPRQQTSQPEPRPSRRERVPGADLHEQLYTPSINEFDDGSWKKPSDDDDSGKGGIY